MQKNRVRKAIAMAVQPLECRKMLANPELIAMTDQATNASVSPTVGSILIYDVSDVRTAGSDPFGVTPLFSIWTGYEITAGGSGRDFEELTAFDVSPDGKSGYLLSFDSGTVGAISPSGDTNADYDLYRIDIELAYNDFTTNNRTRGIMYAPRYSTDYDPAHPDTNTGIDYIDTYGGTLGPTGQPAANSNSTGIIRPRTTLTIIRDNTDADPSNDIIFLDGVTKKIAEVARVQGVSNNFFNQQDIQVVDDTTIVLMENSNILPSATGAVSDDFQIRTLERVSTSPGAATPPVSGSAGGYNLQTSESWNSVQWSGDNYVQMDAPVSPTVFNVSDVDGMRYVDRNGVKGVWVSDRDGTGDDMAYFALDLVTHVATKQEQRVGASPYPEAFAMDEDPAISATTNDGEIDGFDLDANGNLVIREGSFNDTPKAEPKIVTREVVNYNAGDLDANSINELTFGAWSTKTALAPTTDDDPDVTNGLYATYAADQGLMYYFDIDSGNNLDVYVYDIATQTLIFQKLNIATPFLQDGNQIRAFTLGGSGDSIAPTVAQSYAFQTEQSVTFTFSEALATTGAGAFSASDITLTNTTTSTVIPTADLTLVNVGGNVYKLTYKSGAAINPLAKGVYTLTLNAPGITDAAGNALTAPTLLTFKVNPGDTNQDGDVDFDDLLVIAQNYGLNGKNYSQGNVNYDAGGNVNFDDLLLLAQNYGTTLVKATPAPKLAATATAKRKTVGSDVLA